MDAFPFSKGFVIMAANVITSFLGASSISALYVCTLSHSPSLRHVTAGHPHLHTHRIAEAVAAAGAGVAATFYVLVQHPSLLALMRPSRSLMPRENEPHIRRASLKISSHL